MAHNVPIEDIPLQVEGVGFACRFCALEIAKLKNYVFEVPFVFDENGLIAVI